MLNLNMKNIFTFCISVLLLFSCSSNKTLSFTNLKSEWDINYIKSQPEEVHLLSSNNDLITENIEVKNTVIFSGNNFKNINNKKTVFKNILSGNNESKVISSTKNKVQTSSKKDIQFKTNWQGENQLNKENNSGDYLNKYSPKYPPKLSKEAKIIIIVVSSLIVIFGIGFLIWALTFSVGGYGGPW
tara:strand:- start:87 stop:644 length:558 start_codon:yes stop_codon:yes gene_type:complete